MEARNLVLWQKIDQNLLIFVYLFCPNNSTIDCTKSFLTQEWLIVESCSIPRWIRFSMLYRLVYNICSHFIELILAWSAYKYAEFNDIHFFRFWLRLLLLGKSGPKDQNCQFKLKYGTHTNSNMQNSMVVFTFSFLYWKHPFW